MKKEEMIAKEVAKNDIAKEKGKVKAKVKAKVKVANVSKVKEDFIKQKEAKEEKVSAIYKDEVYLTLHKKQRKSFRMKLRRQRNMFAKNIIALHKKKDEKGLQNEIANFMIFYKENYKVNDLTSLSLSAKNNDDDTLQLLNEMLNVIKSKKVKGK